jgi:hypothetical protein
LQNEFIIKVLLRTVGRLEMRNESGEWARFAVAARQCGINEGTLRHWAARGRVETRQVNGVYQVRLETVREAQAHPVRPGRPESPEKAAKARAALLRAIARAEARVVELRAELAMMEGVPE